MQDPQAILKNYWGYDAFKPSQKEIITAVLNGKDTLALLPTGGGKSICYQVPALMQQGICIVVSPLIGLIENQIQQLKQKNIRVIGLMGFYRQDDLQRLLDNCMYGRYKFLYLSPERLQQKQISEAISQMNVSLFAIDEAHCISQWGHDFRPSYRQIVSVRKTHPETPILALTATATHRVVDDIVNNLQMSAPLIIKDNFERKNISYDIYEDVHKMTVVKSLLLKNKSSSIIYVYSRRETTEIARKINGMGIKALPFHGGLSAKEKSEHLSQWINNKVRVIVATNAFGMGIDKPDVYLIIHWTIPDSMENYYQETGRCGRDGTPSRAVLINNPEDITLLKRRFLNKSPDEKFIRQLYKKLNNHFQIAYGDYFEDYFELNFSKFCYRNNLDKRTTYYALKFMSTHGILTFSERIKTSDSVQFIVSGQSLKNYMERSSKIIEAVIQSILRTYSGVYGSKIDIDLTRLAFKINLDKSKYEDTLHTLHNEHIIEYLPTRDDSKIRFLLQREDDYTINPILKHLSKHKTLQKERLTCMINYASKHDVCKTEVLLHYFGENNTMPCEKCYVCKAKYYIKYSKLFQEDILDLLHSEHTISIEKLSQRIKVDVRYISKILQPLISEEKININRAIISLKNK